MIRYLFPIPHVLPSRSTLNQMRKMGANAAKINERVHRLIRPKVRGKWPQHRSMDHLAHVSLSLSFVLRASAFLHSTSILHSPAYSFASAKPGPLSFSPLRLSRCPLRHRDESAYVATFLRTTLRSCRVRDAFALHRVPKRPHSDPHSSPEFQFSYYSVRDQITSKLGKHKREKLSISRDKTIRMSLLGVSITV